MSAKWQEEHTVTGKTFFYEGGLDSDLIIHTQYRTGEVNKTGFRIYPDVIEFLIRQIQIYKDMDMGTCRTSPSSDSLGNMLLQQKKRSPQYLCYIIPLLEKQNFCKIYKANGRYRVKYTEKTK